jgi:hypothetical protein
MNVSDKNPEAFVFTKLNVLHTIKDAFQDADPSTVLVNPPSSMHQEHTFTYIAPKDTNCHIYNNLEQQLHNTTSGHICGTVLFNSSTLPYIQQFRKTTSQHHQRSYLRNGSL